MHSYNKSQWKPPSKKEKGEKNPRGHSCIFNDGLQGGQLNDLYTHLHVTGTYLRAGRMFFHGAFF
jgi:hypothetical protein